MKKPTPFDNLPTWRDMKSPNPASWSSDVQTAYMKAVYILECRMIAEPYNMIHVFDRMKPQMFSLYETLPDTTKTLGAVILELYQEKRTYSAYSIAKRLYTEERDSSWITHRATEHSEVDLMEAFDFFERVWGQYVELSISHAIYGLIKKGFTAEEIRIWQGDERRKYGLGSERKGSDGTAEFEESLESALAGEHIDYPVKPFLSDMRAKIEFYEPGEYVIVAARTGGGKSYYALNQAYHTAKSGVPVAYINLENTPKSVHARLWSMHTGIKWQTDYKNRPWWSVKNGQWTAHETTTEKDLEWMRRAWKEVQAMPIKVLHTGRRLQNILNATRQDYYERGTQLIIPDYIQLMKDKDSKGKTEDLAEISAELRMLSLDLKMVVMPLAQINRSGEQKNADHRATIADLRYCGDLEQDASTIHLLYRPSEYDIKIDPLTKSEYPAEYADVHTGKGRNSGKSLVGCRFNHVVGFYDAISSQPF